MNIREKATDLGFDKVGFARVGELPKADFLREWLAQGMHGDMAYMENIEARLDPSKVLPGARSVVCVLKNYYTDIPQSRDPLEGVVSRYAWGDDYHDSLKDKLHELRRFIEESTGAPAKACVDTNAVMEKLWARQAGLGWQGKHSNLLSRELSSWFFLGEILSAADLQPDAPHKEDYCGTCTACIDVCPTRAIVAPYVVDSRKCIAYLTIEHRGKIPRELRPKMGNLIFGCDLCQDVCPWNKHAKVALDPEFQPREGLTAPRLGEFMDMTVEDFRRRFRGSPIKRAKRGGFLRNVAIALGNSGSPEAVPPLVKGVKDEDPLVRAHAAWGLGRIGTEEARRALEEQRAIESDPSVLEEILQVIGDQ